MRIKNIKDKKAYVNWKDKTSFPGYRGVGCLSLFDIKQLIDKFGLRGNEHAIKNELNFIIDGISADMMSIKFRPNREDQEKLVNALYDDVTSLLGNLKILSGYGVETKELCSFTSETRKIMEMVEYGLKLLQQKFYNGIEKIKERKPEGKKETERKIARTEEALSKYYQRKEELEQQLKAITDSAKDVQQEDREELKHILISIQIMESEVIDWKKSLKEKAESNNSNPGPRPFRKFIFFLANFYENYTGKPPKVSVDNSKNALAEPFDNDENCVGKLYKGCFLDFIKAIEEKVLISLWGANILLMPKLSEALDIKNLYFRQLAGPTYILTNQELFYLEDEIITADFTKTSVKEFRDKTIITSERKDIEKILHKLKANEITEEKIFLPTGSELKTILLIVSKGTWMYFWPETDSALGGIVDDVLKQRKSHTR